MPYIKQTDREQLDQLTDALATRIASLGVRVEDHAGNLNYVITRLVLALIGPPKILEDRPDVRRAP